jgi:hypothetical protein
MTSDVGPLKHLRLQNGASYTDTPGNVGQKASELESITADIALIPSLIVNSATACLRAVC